MAAPAWHIDKGQWLGMLCVAAASLAVFKLLQVVAACVYKLWVLRAMPGPPQHLFVGNLTAFLQDSSHRVVLGWARQYGPVFQIRMLWQPIVVVTDPQVFTKFLANTPDKLEKGTGAYRAFTMLTKPRGTPNILTSEENSLWRAVRRAVAPAFSIANIKRGFPHMVMVTQRVISSLNGLKSEESVEMDSLAQRLTLDVIALFGFEHDAQATVQGSACKMQGIMSNMIPAMQARGNPLNRWFPWRKAYRDLRHWSDRLDEYIEELVANMRAQPPALYTLGAQLLACVDPQTGAPLAHARLKSEIAILFGAGYDTTAHSLGWTLFLLSTHPEEERKVADELASLGLLATNSQPEPRQLQWEDLHQLKQLNAVIMEALRLYPAASSGTLRLPKRPIQVGGHMVAARTSVWVHIGTTQRSQQHWQDADDFRPSRWLNDDAVGADDDLGNVKSKGGFLPFSEGTRNCIGQALALTEMRVVLAMLCGHFKFELRADMGGFAGVDRDAKVAMTLRPEHGLWMHVRPRVVASS